MENREKLAVIGSGIGGLSAAWLLKDKFDVTVFEQFEKPGMGIYSVDYRSNGIHSRIDIPLRIFCDGYYPNLLALYKRLGIAIESTNHSAAFADQHGQLFFHYAKLAFHSHPIALPKGRSLFSINAWQIGLTSKRFFKQAKQDLENEDLRRIKLQQYLNRYSYHPDFIEGLLLPTLATICTCDYNSILNYPADLILGYLSCGVMKQGVVRAAKGVDDIVPRLLRGCNVIAGAKIATIQSDNKQLKLQLETGQEHDFNHIVIATQAQQAALMLDDFPAQQALLQQVPYEQSSMAVHTDQNILPKHHIPLSPVTYLVDRQQQRPCTTVNLSTAMPHFKGHERVFQTWNPQGCADAPRQDQLIAQVDFTRPTVTLESRKAVQALQGLHCDPDRNIWLCGSYMAERLPLLDAAVDSAMQVAEHLGVQAPWKG